MSDDPNRREIPQRYKPLVGQVLVNLATAGLDVTMAAIAACRSDADEVNAEYDEWLEQQK